MKHCNDGRVVHNLVHAMECMALNKRDKGTVANMQKHKSLNERIFAKNENNDEKKADEVTKQGNQIIERGTVLGLWNVTDAKAQSRRFVVMDVFKKYSGK